MYMQTFLGTQLARNMKKSMSRNVSCLYKHDSEHLHQSEYNWLNYRKV